VEPCPAAEAFLVDVPSSVAVVLPGVAAWALVASSSEAQEAAAMTDVSLARVLLGPWALWRYSREG